MKKILSLTLALVMIIGASCMMMISASAATTSVASMAELVAAVNTADSTIEATAVLTVAAGETIDLDLNGCTVDLGSHYIENNGTLTITNGTIIADEFNDDTNGAPLLSKAGTLTVNADISGLCAAVRCEGGETIINGGEYKANGDNGKTTCLIRMKGGELTINDGEFIGCNSTNGSEGCTLTSMSGGEISIAGGSFSEIAAKPITGSAASTGLSIAGGEFDLTASIGENYKAEDILGGYLASSEYVIKLVSGKVYAVVDATVAKIGATKYTSLQEAIDNAVNGDVITLVADVTENVTVVQYPDIKITIDGDGHTLTGYINIDGRSHTNDGCALTIENLNFEAKDIPGTPSEYDACIRLGKGNSSNPRYAGNITVENCTFTDSGANTNDVVCIKQYTGGEKDDYLRVTNCTADETMHSLLNVANVSDITVTDCVINSKSGLNLNSSINTEITGCTFNVKEYAVRTGAGNGGTADPTVTIEDCTISTAAGKGEDAAIIIRGGAKEAATLSIEESVVVTAGADHIAGTTSTTTVTADNNHWGEGISAPVVSGSAVEVENYYADADLTKLVEGGELTEGIENSYAQVFGKVDLRNGEIKAGQFKFQIRDKDGKVIGTVSNDKNGNIRFPVLKYNKPGSRTYTVTQVNTGAKGITYDTRSFSLTVHAYYDATYNLKILITMPKDIEFINK